MIFRYMEKDAMIGDWKMVEEVAEPRGWGSAHSEEELDLIPAWFFPSSGFNLELPSPNDRVTRLPQGRLGVYEGALLVSSRFFWYGFVR